MLHTDFISEHGEVSDYNKLSEKILQFFVRGNKKVQAWVLLDDRYDSFYGATFSIPFKQITPQNDKEYRILLIGSNSLLDKYKMSVLDDDLKDTLSDRDSLVNNVNNNQIKETRLVNILKQTFPLSTIDEVFLENVISPRQSIIESVYNYVLENHDKYDYVIFDGIESSLLFAGDDDNYIKQIDTVINSLDSLFKENNIKSCYVHIPIGKYNYVIPESAKLKFDTTIDIIEVLGRIDRNYVEKDYLYLSDRAHYFINNSILSRIFNIGVSNFYLSFMYKNITSDSYSEFLRDSYEHTTEEYNRDINKRVITTIYGSNNHENLFKETGEFISIGYHTSFDYGLWMSEQGGITCEQETNSQIAKFPLMKGFVFYNGVPSNFIDIPVYPTTGCPWITHTTKNMSDYHIDENNKIIYYLTKNNYGGSITVRFHDNSGKFLDAWQSIEFGMPMDSVIDNSKLYLYIGGGTGALSPYLWTYYTKSYTSGYVYDLNIRNIDITNGNIIYPCACNEKSNLRIYNSGNWQDIYNMTSNYEIYNYYSCGSEYRKMLIITPPTYTKDKNSGYLGVKKNNLVDMDGNIPLFPIQVTADMQFLSLATFSNSYLSSSSVLKEGINRIKDEYYLVIPNGWNNRLYTYPVYHNKVVHPYDDNNYIRDLYFSNTSISGENVFHDKLVLDFNIEVVTDKNNYVDIPEHDIKNNVLLEIECTDVYDILFGYNNDGISLYTLLNDEESRYISGEYVVNRNNDLHNIKLCLNSFKKLSIRSNYPSSSDLRKERREIITNKLQEASSEPIVFGDMNECELCFIAKKDNYYYDTKTAHSPYKYYDCIKHLYLNKNTIACFDKVTLPACKQDYLDIPFNNDIDEYKFQLNIEGEYESLYICDGFKTNIWCNLNNSKVTSIYLPPSISCIYFNTIPSDSDIFCYSNKRLTFVDDMNVKSIHVRKEVYDFIKIDYPQFINKVSADII